jgi:geranylgeranyl pyrophosphate synthase
MSDVVAVADLGGDRSAIDAELARVIPPASDELAPPLADAVRYALRGAGKRLRGMLLLAAYRAVGGTGDAVALAAAAEMLHAYSLVHDDLPCMDDDDVRRGRPTTHRAFGVPAATVGGVVMIPLAAREIAHACARLGCDEQTTRAVMRELMAAVGARGMIGGQLADLAAEETPAVSEGTLDAIHRRKTGALIAACARAGALAGGGAAAAVETVGGFASDLGLAFQIVDDVLDVTRTSTELGKTAGRDVALGKSTYPAAIGVDAAMERARSLSRDGCRRLAQAGLLTPPLQYLAELVTSRTN